jgi:hypothetical protein
MLPSKISYALPQRSRHGPKIASNAPKIAPTWLKMPTDSPTSPKMAPRFQSWLQNGFRWPKTPQERYPKTSRRPPKTHPRPTHDHPNKDSGAGGRAFALDMCIYNYTGGSLFFELKCVFFVLDLLDFQEEQIS